MDIEEKESFPVCNATYELCALFCTVVIYSVQWWGEGSRAGRAAQRAWCLLHLAGQVGRLRGDRGHTEDQRCPAALQWPRDDMAVGFRTKK